MNSDQLKDLLNKIPFSALGVAILLWFAYLYFDFNKAETSILGQKSAEIEAVKVEIAKLQVKLNEVKEFKRTIEGRRSSLQILAKRLDDMKASVSENLDVADFMKTVITEAKRVGLTVLRLDPGAQNAKEYYVEHPFNLVFKGVYSQFVVFLQRLAVVQKIVRVDAYTLKPVSASTARFVELEGQVEIKAYRYLASAADSLGRSDGKGAASPSQSSASPAGQPPVQAPASKDATVPGAGQ